MVHSQVQPRVWQRLERLAQQRSQTADELLETLLDEAEAKPLDKGLALDDGHSYEWGLRWLVARIPVIVYIIDAQGTFTLSIGKSLEKLGLEENEVVGQNVFDLYSDTPSVRDGMRRVLAGEEVHFIEEVGEIPFESWYFPLKNTTGEIVGMMGIAIDLTKQQRAAAAEREQYRLQTKLEQVTELSQLKSRFMELISHEFRTPLSIIQTSAQILQRYGHKLTTEDQHRHLAKTVRQVQDLQSVMEQIEFTLQLHMDKPVYRREKMNARAVIRSLVRSFQHRHPTQQIRHVLKGQPRPMYADEHMFRQMFSSLLQNALNYAGNNPVVLIKEVYQAHGLELTLHNHGEAISAYDQQHIFEPFYRGANAQDIPGTGLGLSIVQDVVQMHDGEITLSSQPNEGTTVVVSLPYGAPNTV